MGKVRVIEIKAGNGFIESIRKHMAEKRERIERIHKEIPAIHWEVLGYSNHHTKDEVLLKYPEHTEFINKIHFWNP